MIQHTTKPLEQRLRAAEELLKSTRNPEEKYALQNYIHSLHTTIYELNGRKGPYFTLHEIIGDKEYHKNLQKDYQYDRKWFLPFLKQKKFHFMYLGELLYGIDEDIEQLSDFDFPADEPIRRKEMIEILYAFFESMGIEELFDRYYREKHIFALNKDKWGRNSGFVNWNPVSKEGNVYVREFKNDVRTMKIIAHEMGHIFDHAQDFCVEDYNHQVLTSFYGEVISRLFEKMLEHFLLKSEILVPSAKEEVISSALTYHDDLLKAFVFSLFSNDCLRGGDYYVMKEEDLRKKIKKYFGNNLNMKETLKFVHEGDIKDYYRYAYGDVISLFLLDEIEKKGVSDDLFDYFLEHKNDVFDPYFLASMGCEPVDYIRLYQDEIKLIKK